MAYSKLVLTVVPLGDSSYEIHLPLRKEDFTLQYDKELGWMLDEFDSSIREPKKAYRDSSSLANNMDNSLIPDWDEVFDWIGAFNV
jgi:hypothetical protein